MNAERYDNRYADEWRALRSESEKEARLHGGVVRNSVMAATENGAFFGAGYLIRGQGRFYHLAFDVDTRDLRSIDAAEALLHALTAFFETEIRTSEPDAVLRLWAHDTMKSYGRFLRSFGFRVSDRMDIMERDLSAAEWLRGSGRTEDSRARASVLSNNASISGLDLSNGASISEFDLSDGDAMRAYVDATERAFTIPDRADEMRYRISECGAEVLAVTERSGRFPVSFLTYWPIDEQTAATENIFTEEACRRRGYAGALLDEAAHRIRQDGRTTARLTVYQSDKEAIALYEAKGYKKTATLFEYHYFPRRKRFAS